MYGGTAGRKMGITYEGKDYLLKFPGNLKEQQMKNITMMSLVLKRWKSSLSKDIQCLS